MGAPMLDETPIFAEGESADDPLATQAIKGRIRHAGWRRCTPAAVLGPCCGGPNAGDAVFRRRSRT